jgi:hypothetical protein
MVLLLVLGIWAVIYGTKSFGVVVFGGGIDEASLWWLCVVLARARGGQRLW